MIYRLYDLDQNGNGWLFSNLQKALAYAGYLRHWVIYQGQKEVKRWPPMKFDYVLWDLDTGAAWSFEDVQEARASAEQRGFRHWSIMYGNKLVDQHHKNGRFIDLRERYASVFKALDSVPKEQVLNLINLWAETSGTRDDLLEELEEAPVVWMRATDLGEEDA